jgi:hypothetical protein
MIPTFSDSPGLKLALSSQEESVLKMVSHLTTSWRADTGSDCQESQKDRPNEVLFKGDRFTHKWPLFECTFPPFSPGRMASPATRRESPAHEYDEGDNRLRDI